MKQSTAIDAWLIVVYRSVVLHRGPSSISITPIVQRVEESHRKIKGGTEYHALHRAISF